ncbi:MAG: aminoglycoside phosphotransferase family protein [Planctomycetes bacterium]|jgi:thiamine kinase-like enzyme|nr:aminoglycoside phosphotransferase family protein [Planctomycetota bacterium]
MNKILNLLDDKYVKKIFIDQFLPLHPEIIGIKLIKPIFHKKMIWESTYHVVLEFKTTVVYEDKTEETFPIFCSAHSNEERRNVYNVLHYLWSKEFVNDSFTLPKPLFYDEELRGIFYRGVEGETLLYYLKHKELEEVKDLVKKTAHLFARLHKIDIFGAYNFNTINAEIKTVVPGIDYIFSEINSRYQGQYDSIIQKYYQKFITTEEYFLNNSERCIVHGDAHPENVIKVNDKQIALIDFTDMHLGDFTRDLGSFLQQIGYKIGRNFNNPDLAISVQTFFLQEYLQVSDKKLNEELKQRIENYYHWTAMRTATYFLLNHNPDHKRAEAFFKEIDSGRPACLNF